MRWWLVVCVAAAALVCLAGCIEPSLGRCPGNIACPVGTVCDGHGGCATPEQLSSCVGASDGATCSYTDLAGRAVDGGCSAQLCVPLGCGNQQLSPDEVCDDGNTLNGDGCSADCRSDETCGNGVVDPAADEQCDDGNLTDGDACQRDCKTPRCGDGIVDSALLEACDAGAANSSTLPDTCRTTCQLPRCGDGVIDTGEVCDDGNNQSGDGCSGDCISTEMCGNGILDFATGEQCDDGAGNGDQPDGCRGDCKLARCGDGVTDPGRGEQCDEGDANADASDQCRTSCLRPRCGDQIVDLLAGEVCDDANLDNGDGCRPDCRSNETCGNGMHDPAVGEQCDDANLIGRDGCSACKIEELTVKLPGEAPSARSGHGLAYDAARQRVVLFGGQSGNTYLNDTWEWDGASWTQLRPRTVPGARTNMVLTYDGTRHRVVMFGGRSSATPLGDTWEWDGRDWVERQSAAPLAAREAAAATWDPLRKVVVMAGGVNVSNNLNDGLWAWTGTTWTRIANAVTALSNRARGALAFDPVRNNLVIVGGTNSNTWTWDGTTFTDHGAAPFGIKRVTATFDARRGRVVAWINDSLSTATWEWDGSTWTSTAGSLITARTDTRITFDAMRGQVVLFGGLQTSTALAGTFVRTDTSWTSPPPLSPPAYRSRAGAVYDPLRKRVLIGGGTAAPPGSGSDYNYWIGDYHEWDGTRWVDQNGIPGILTSVALSIDEAGSVLISGVDPNADAYLWRLDGSTLTPLVSATSTVQYSMMTAYDLARRELVSMGSGGGYTWNQGDGMLSTGFPLDVYNGGLAYDPGRQRLVQFGGNGPAISTIGEVWERSGSTWTHVRPPPGSPAPTNRRAAPLAYAPDVQRVVMFGNNAASSEQFWEWDGARWNQRLVDQPVPSRYGAALVYDAARHQFVRFGGRTSTGPTDELFLLEYHSYVPVEACTEATLDYDEDGLAGCADPECWSTCAPLCTPGTNCPVDAPRCGDATCDPFEDCRICPGDCGMCTGACGDFHCDQGEQATCAADCT